MGTGDIKRFTIQNNKTIKKICDLEHKLYGVVEIELFPGAFFCIFLRIDSEAVPCRGPPLVLTEI